MNFFARLRCSLTSRQSWRDYYANLSEPELRSRQRTLWQTYLVTSVAWVVALTLTLYFGTMDTPLLVLYSVVVALLLWSTYRDYRQRKSYLEECLDKMV